MKALEACLVQKHKEYIEARTSVPTKHFWFDLRPRIALWADVDQRVLLAKGHVEEIGIDTGIGVGMFGGFVLIAWRAYDWSNWHVPLGLFWAGWMLCGIACRGLYHHAVLLVTALLCVPWFAAEVVRFAVSFLTPSVQSQWGAAAIAFLLTADYLWRAIKNHKPISPLDLVPVNVHRRPG